MSVSSRLKSPRARSTGFPAIKKACATHLAEVAQINTTVAQSCVDCALSVLRPASPGNFNGLPALMVYETARTP